MNLGKLVFAQVMEHLPLHVFHRCVVRYSGEHKVKWFSCLDQYLCMAFAQLTYRESLRDIEACLRAKLQALSPGISQLIARNTLANANATRDWRIYCDFAQSLIGIARRLYAEEALGVDLRTPSTRSMPPRSTCVCRSFPGRRFARPKRRSSCTRSWTCAAISRPSFTSAMASCTTSIFSTVGARAGRLLRHGSRLHRLRSVRSLSCRPAASSLSAPRLTSRPSADSRIPSTEARASSAIRTVSSTASTRARASPRRCVVSGSAIPRPASDWSFSPTTSLARPHRSPSSIAARWQIELFFKWIKQHLRIKAFFGTSENAVKTQIWIASRSTCSSPSSRSGSSSPPASMKSYRSSA